MSRVLSATLEGIAAGGGAVQGGEVPGTGAIERASERIRAAYDRLKAMGL
jgi:hypothetical protein